MNTNGHDRTFGLQALCDRAWNDDAFSKRLDQDPKAALAEFMRELPNDVDIKVVRDTADTRYVHIPAMPSHVEVSDQDLMQAQGGSGLFCVISMGIGTGVVGSVSVIATAIIEQT
ncbi:MAG: nitrile hydratase subunit alpha [Paracoccaceae bacterium]